jgi:TonB family protein
MYVTSTGNGRSLIVSSADSGAHWTTVSSPATWIKCFGSTTRRLFIGTFTEGLFSTSDGGASWSQCDQILARNLVSGIISFRDTLFVATTGVFQSNDDGASWTDISENLQQVPVTSVAVCGRYLFAVTEKNGLWRRPLNELITSAPARDNASVPGSSSLAQNFPNPFNPTTTIAYDVPAPSRVKLAVYDILGREISVLVDSDVRAGKGVAKFDGSTRSSGVYIYRIEGKVVVRLLVGKDGTVRQAVVEHSTAEILNDAALDAARLFRFTPAIMNNGPVTVWVLFPFTFRLR